MAPTDSVPAQDAVASATDGEAFAAEAQAFADAQKRAARHTESDQKTQVNGKAASGGDANLAKLVAEENASKSKFPRYPGLERWELVEKMGDGAFSNVYRARDTKGQHGEVAIKVVRKYEMNSMQVSTTGRVPPALPPFHFLASSCLVRLPSLKCSALLDRTFLRTFQLEFLEHTLLSLLFFYYNQWDQHPS